MVKEVKPTVQRCVCFLDLLWWGGVRSGWLQRRCGSSERMPTAISLPRVPVRQLEEGLRNGIYVRDNSLAELTEGKCCIGCECSASVQLVFSYLNCTVIMSHTYIQTSQLFKVTAMITLIYS